MIKFIADSGKGGRFIIGFGLSEENLVRLRAGQPICIKLSEMGCKVVHDNNTHDAEILIHYGKTETDIAREFAAVGLIGPKTKVKPEGGS